MRGFVYAFSIVTAVVYAVIRTVAFHKPERQVSFEMMAWLLILNVVAVLIYCVRHISVAQRAYTFPVWLRYAGIIACIILLGAPHVSISTVQAAIINQRLESAARSVEPDKAAKLPDKQLETRFRKISAIANASITYKIPANPELMNKAQISIEETLRAANPRSQSVRNSGVAAFVATIAYARANNLLVGMNVPTILLGHGQTGNMMLSQVPLKNSAWWQGSPEGNTIFAMPYPESQPVFPVSPNTTVIFNNLDFNAFGGMRSFVGTDGKSQVVVMNATIHAVQKLDFIVWLNVRFVGSIILYNGGPLYLGNVTFENCRFQFGSDAESQKVLAQIRNVGNEPVSLVSGLY